MLCDTLYLAITKIDLHWVYDILCVLFLLAVLAFWQPRSKNLRVVSVIPGVEIVDCKSLLSNGRNCLKKI